MTQSFISLPNFLIKSVGVVVLLTASFGTAYACTLPKSDFKNLKCTTTADRLVAFKDNGAPVALVDRKGKKVADLFAYDAVLISQFHSGLMPIKQGGKVGYIDRNGKLVIPAIYDSFGGSQWAKGVSGGRIVVKQKGKTLTLDTNGRVIGQKTDPKDEKPKKDDKKTVTSKTDSRPKSETPKTTAQPTKTTTNKANTAKTTSTPPPHYQNPNWADDNFFAHKQGDKWGYVNRNHVPMIVYAFDGASPFSEGLAGVKMGDKWGFITPAGDLVIDFRFDDKGVDILSNDVPELVSPFVFKNGRAWVGNLKDGQKLCINKKGENVNCQTGQSPNNKPTNTLIETLENLPILLPAGN